MALTRVQLNIKVQTIREGQINIQEARVRIREVLGTRVALISIKACQVSTLVGLDSIKEAQVHTKAAQVSIQEGPDSTLVGPINIKGVQTNIKVAPVRTQEGPGTQGFQINTRPAPVTPAGPTTLEAPFRIKVAQTNIREALVNTQAGLVPTQGAQGHIQAPMHIRVGPNTREAPVALGDRATLEHPTSTHRVPTSMLRGPISTREAPDIQANTQEAKVNSSKDLRVSNIREALVNIRVPLIILEAPTNIPAVLISILALRGTRQAQDNIRVLKVAIRGPQGTQGLLVSTRARPATISKARAPHSILGTPAGALNTSTPGGPRPPRTSPTRPALAIPLPPHPTDNIQRR